MTWDRATSAERQQPEAISSPDSAGNAPTAAASGPALSILRMPSADGRNTSLLVQLPWPHKSLSPNGRKHHLERAKFAKEYKAACHWLAKASGAREMTAPISATMIFFPPDDRHRDTDNMIASIKAAIDGVSAAIGVDDRHWQMTFLRGDPVKGGAVLMEIEQLDRWQSVGSLAARLLKHAERAAE